VKWREGLIFSDQNRDEPPLDLPEGVYDYVLVVFGKDNQRHIVASDHLSPQMAVRVLRHLANAIEAER
jgi:hypothetical protein